MLAIRKLPAWDWDESESVSEPGGDADGTPSAHPVEKVAPAANDSEPRFAGNRDAASEQGNACATRTASDSTKAKPAGAGDSLEAVPKDRKGKGGKRFSTSQKGILIVGFVATVFFACLLYRSSTHPPRPVDVFLMQRFYISEGRVIQRDSNPIEPTDALFYLTQDQAKDTLVIDDWVIDNLTPFYAYDYFNYLKNGLPLSDNFYDKYESLVARWHLTMLLQGFLILLSLCTLVVPFLFLGKRKSVGVMRGSSWKS